VEDSGYKEKTKEEVNQKKATPVEPQQTFCLGNLSKRSKQPDTLELCFSGLSTDNQ